MDFFLGVEMTFFFGDLEVLATSKVVARFPSNFEEENPPPPPAALGFVGSESKQRFRFTLFLTRRLETALAEGTG